MIRTINNMADQPTTKRIAWAIPLITTIGSVISSWFGTKTAGMTAVSQGAAAVIGFLNNTNMSEAQREQAIAQVLAADSSSESWLARNWRPLVSCVLWGMVFAMFCGYHPTVFDQAITPTMNFILETARGCLFGYMPLRSVDKWINQAYQSKIFDKIINAIVNK